MKIELAQKRKLVAVIGWGGEGLFLPTPSGSIMYLDFSGIKTACTPESSLEEVAGMSDRTPVYEGDTVTIQF